MIKLSDSALKNLKTAIESIVAQKELLQKKSAQDDVITVLRHLESGELRVSTPKGYAPNCGSVPMAEGLETWETHPWVKESIILAMKMRLARTKKFSLQDLGNSSATSSEGRIHGDYVSYCDKFDMQNEFASEQTRRVFGSLVREGAYIGNQVVLMPSFVNIGAWVGSLSMVDTWATVGSCAQVGSGVHIAGGVGIGGVLEPAHGRPVLIGDGAFLGSRAILVEGVVVGQGAILGANVCLTASIPIYDMTTSEKKEYRGFVPPYAIVAPGVRPKEMPGGTVFLQCAYILGYRDALVESKVSLNNALRETGLAV